MSLARAARACTEQLNFHKACNAFISRNQSHEIELAASVADQRWSSGDQLSAIDGRTVAIKDNIATIDLPTTCASKALDGYQSPYEATVVRKLMKAGAVIVGKTNLDEFGMGSHSRNSYYGPVIQPSNNKDQTFSSSAGGSSGGSAVGVQTGQAEIGIGTDTGGSIRLPAAYTGTTGFKPSYGMISRYGVVPYANSLDTVGILGSIDHISATFNVVRGVDDKDPTSLSTHLRARLKESAAGRRRKDQLTIGFPTEYNTAELDPVIRETWQRSLVRLAEAGHQIVPVSLPATKLALPAYYILAPAEASSNLAKYDGVRYGNATDMEKSEGNVLFATGRGENLGEEVKRRILLGSFTLSASAINNYFLQAQRIRRLVQEDFDRVFAFPNLLRGQKSDNKDGIDLLLVPTAPSLPPRTEDLAQRNVMASYGDDVLTVPASLAGLPAISIPARRSLSSAATDQHGSVGLQLIGQFGDDDFVLDTAARLQSEISVRCRQS